MTEPRPRYPLVWGMGLDRNTGAMTVEGASFQDLRNAWAEESKLVLRGGLEVTEADQFFENCTDIVAIFPFRAIQGSVTVGYNRVSRVLSVWRTDGAGGTRISVGEWATLGGGAPLPRITGAESYGKFFLAHDEPLMDFRANTVYFDPVLDPGAQIVTLQGNFDGDGDADVKFRIVYTYLSYLCGAGYGTAEEPNRPEILRMSLPANPVTFNKQHYAIFGIRDDAITALGTAGGVLCVMKRTSSYVLIGTDRKTFGVRGPVDEKFGAINHQLGQSIGDTYYYWSEHGPRFTKGGASGDLAIPLELDGPQPETLAESGAIEYGFAAYHPERRGVLWHFPQLDPVIGRTLVYALSVRNTQLFKWHYWELFQDVYCAAVLVEGEITASEQPTAYASAVSATEDGLVGTARQVNVAWTNNQLGGGETAQIFKKEVGGAWSLATSVDAAGGAQNVDIPGFIALSDYEFAIRMVRDGVATEGYEQSDPDDWTALTEAGSKDTLTTLCSAPVITAAVWSRTSISTTQIAFAFTLAELGVGFKLERSDDGIAGWAVVADIPAAGNPRTYNYAIPTIDELSTKYFRIRAYKGVNFSAYSATAEVYLGPAATDLGVPEFLLVAQDSVTSEMQMFIQIPPEDADKIEIQTSADGVTGWTTQYLDVPTPYPIEVPSPIALASATFYRARFISTAFGVDDPGEWSTPDDITLTNAAPPAAAVFGTTSCENFEAGSGSTRCATMTVNLSAPGDYYLFYERNSVGAGQVQGTGIAERVIEIIAADDTLQVTDAFIEGLWNPFALPLGSQPGYEVEFEARLFSGIKIGDADSETQKARITGGPNTLVIDQPNPLVGKLDVTWTNDNPVIAGFPPIIVLAWVVGPGFDGSPNRLGKVLDTEDELLNAPGAGLVALPASGTEIKIFAAHGSWNVGDPSEPSAEQAKWSDVENFDTGGTLHEMGT